MNRIKSLLVLFALCLCLCACKSVYEIKESQILKIEEAIANSPRAQFNLPAYPHYEKPTNVDFWGKPKIDNSTKQIWQKINHTFRYYMDGGCLVDFETNSIFIFYYKEVGGKYVLLEEESYFYKNKFQKWFGETSPENVYIRMLFSYEGGKFIGIDLYENSLDDSGGLVSSHRELSPDEMREILAEWRNFRAKKDRKFAAFRD